MAFEADGKFFLVTSYLQVLIYLCWETWFQTGQKLVAQASSSPEVVPLYAHAQSFTRLFTNAWSKKMIG